MTDMNYNKTQTFGELIMYVDVQPFIWMKTSVVLEIFIVHLFFHSKFFS